ncbi:MAG: hypothetical protein R3343_10000 [Nitriliruptorales bacterium]|nr:hypothetical protein [Nitriliruptorales bacterium]
MQRATEAGVTALLAASLALSACAGPEEQTAVANSPTRPSSPTPSPTEDGPATTADGRLDFGSVAGTWSGNVEWRLYGEVVDPGAFEVHVEDAAERTAAVGTISELGAAGGTDAVCTGTLLAVDADPPTYVFRVRWDDDQVCTGSGRVILRQDPDAEVVSFKLQSGDTAAEGDLAPVPTS